MNLWIDSTDFPLERKRSARTGRQKRGRKSRYWSFKLNKPGRRYHYALNGHASTVWLSAGYGPKKHDSQYIEENRFEFETKFRGGHFVGDEHYRKAGRLLTDPVFSAPWRDNGELTAQQKKFNRELRHLRSRVEMPFGWLKTTFKALSMPWAGKIDQLDYLVAYATAIHAMIA